MTSRTSELMVGLVALSVASESPAQSENSSHTTYGFCAFSNASAIFDTYDAGRASAAVIMVQNFIKSRLETPRLTRPWYTLSSCIASLLLFNGNISKQ